MQVHNVELASGLIGIGRTWGYNEAAPPSEQDAALFLDSALAESIRYFDTAPAYGLSESRLGMWLETLSPGQRDELTIATKFGEHWSESDQKAYVDHSYEALKASLDQSIARLGKVDILQLHKTTPAVLRSDDLRRAWDYARERGVTKFGASVSDVESGELVCDDDMYEIIQLPFNQQNTTFAHIIDKATRNGKMVVVNRPFNMGELVDSGNADRLKSELQKEAFAFILRQAFDGFILTGTKSPEHLRENVESFNRARYSI